MKQQPFESLSFLSQLSEYPHGILLEMKNPTKFSHRRNVQKRFKKSHENLLCPKEEIGESFWHARHRLRHCCCLLKTYLKCYDLKTIQFSTADIFVGFCCANCNQGNEM